MENASKALIMAAEILLGVMILSIGVYLFVSFGTYSSETYEQIEEKQISEFNAQFLKYYGKNNGVPVECTIHDIVSLANLAQKNNLENELIEAKPTGGYTKRSGVTLANSLYVQIDLGSTSNLELKSNSDLVKIVKQNDLKVGATGTKSEVKYYECRVCEPRGDNKRINYVKFVEIP